MAMMATLHIKPASLEAIRLVKEVNLLCGDDDLETYGLLIAAAALVAAMVGHRPRLAGDMFTAAVDASLKIVDDHSEIFGDGDGMRFDS